MEQKDIIIPLSRENRLNIIDNFTALFNTLVQSGLDASEAKRLAEEALAKAGENRGYLENNRGVDFPLKSVTFREETLPVRPRTQEAVLDAKVFGAKIDCYYKLTMVANGYLTQDKARYGITVEEYRKSDFDTVGYRNRYIFIYNDSVVVPGNYDNANWQKLSDGIETITVDNGEIAVAVTVDRAAITNSSSPEFLNINSDSPTAIIDPSNYFF